jgi:hypothetical protein
MLWSDNSVAMLEALFRMQLPLTAGGTVAPPCCSRFCYSVELERLGKALIGGNGRS